MKIYKIIADSPDGKFYCYIGSTSKELHKRLRGHKLNFSKYLKKKYHYCTSFKIIQKSWFEISLIEDLGDCSKEKLLDKEDYYINYYKSLVDDYIIVNKCKPNGLDLNKKKEYIKSDLYIKKKKLYAKKYRESNKEKIKEYNKHYWNSKKKKEL